MINWKEFTVDSTNPGWESNPGHLFSYHTTKPSKICIDIVNTVYMNKYQSTFIYHIYKNLSL